MTEKTTGETVLLAVGVIFLSFMALFFLTVFGTLMGAISGWAVGLFFGDTILGILSQLGIKGITMWQFGAFMGFVGGFLKSWTYKMDKDGKTTTG